MGSDGGIEEESSVPWEVRVGEGMEGDIQGARDKGYMGRVWKAREGVRDK